MFSCSKIDQPGRDNDEVVWTEDYVALDRSLFKDSNHIQLNYLLSAAVVGVVPNQFHLLLVSKVGEPARTEDGLPSC